MAKLPKIYQNTIEKEIHNNKKVYYGRSSEQSKVEHKNQEEPKDVLDIIDEIFSLPTYSFNIPLSIYTKDKVYNTSLIAKSKNTVITFDNDVIILDDIVRIEKRS